MCVPERLPESPEYLTYRGRITKMETGCVGSIANDPHDFLRLPLPHRAGSAAKLLGAPVCSPTERPDEGWNF